MLEAMLSACLAMLVTLVAGNPLLAELRRRKLGKSYTGDEPAAYEAPASFVGAFRDNFAYYGMKFGGIANANCEGGYDSARHDALASGLAREIRRES